MSVWVLLIYIELGDAQHQWNGTDAVAVYSSEAKCKAADLYSHSGHMTACQRMELDPAANGKELGERATRKSGKTDI
ncbi:MAG: hypothetical protein HRJ53_25075 [Acidobacteria bacterium Pan2503]|uniref:Uncharacterized protein n=1 Tax=Candidatus Acidiferrum panamense TaxID=2741543 RepID=A0A7V8NW10_9BACT|nr:hypothetical protein [Candidatus Acidoferrum panamensis]